MPARYRCWLLPVAAQPAHGVYGVALLLFSHSALLSAAASFPWPLCFAPSHPPRRNGVTGPATLFLALNKTLAQRSGAAPFSNSPSKHLSNACSSSLDNRSPSSHPDPKSPVLHSIENLDASSPGSTADCSIPCMLCIPSPSLRRCKPLTFAFAPPKGCPSTATSRQHKQTRKSH